MGLTRLYYGNLYGCKADRNSHDCIMGTCMVINLMGTLMIVLWELAWLLGV